MTDKPATTKSDAYWDAFEQFAASRAGTEPAWLQSLRRGGIAAFAELGFPTVNDEDWRFTNLSELARLPFKFPARPATLAYDQLKTLPLTSLTASRLVFVDGVFQPTLSNLLPQTGGVLITNTAHAVTAHSALAEQTLGRLVRGDINGIEALNCAFFTDGAFIYVPADAAVSGLIHLLFVNSGTAPNTARFSRNVISVGAHGRATIAETHVSLAPSGTVSNIVTELTAGDGANIEHVKFQDENDQSFHLATIHAHLGKAVNLRAHSIVTGARLSRYSIRTNLAGQGIEAILNGLYLTGGTQVADHHMVVEHAQPHCNSHEYFNGILDDHSKGVFHGRILVRPIAQKTDAKQTNKNLLLSDNATADTKPQLEIYADDVKCTHGATIGQLNDESIFYLRARGIGLEKARRMLIHSFAGEIMQRIQHSGVREELDLLIWDRLEEHKSAAVAVV